MLWFALLGPLEVTAWGARVRLRGAKQRALLAILLLNANRTVATDRLIDLLWEQEPPDTAPTALQVYISGLRKALEPDRSRGAPAQVVVSRASGYELAVSPEQVDLLRFEQLVREGRAAASSGDHAAAAELLRLALRLWRGPALADFAYAPFAQGEIARLEELRLAVLEERIEADLALGRHQELAGELEAVVEAHPLREGLHASRMLALYRSGRQAEALEAYGRARDLLLDELGIDPGSNLRNLERAILEQASSIELGSKDRPSAPSAPQVERRRRRKVVTSLSCEVGMLSMEAADADPESFGSLMTEVVEVVRATVERHGGGLHSGTAGRLTALFGIPTVHEDDALRAVRAAFEARAEVGARFGDSALRFYLSIGVSTGEAVTGVSTAGGGLPLGGVVNRAAALGQAAAPHEILLGEETFPLVSDALEVEQVEVFSRSAPNGVVRARRALQLKPDAPGRRRRHDAPLVGRESELDLLQRAYGRIAEGRNCFLLLILGPAGIGKSRLLTTAVRRLEDRAEVLRTGCLPYGENAALWPLEQLVRQTAHIADDAPPQDVELALAGSLGRAPEGERAALILSRMLSHDQVPTAPEERSWAVRKLLESVAESRPIVLVIDDIHWAEPAFLEVVEHLIEWMRGPLLLVCAGRPDFLDARAHWGVGRGNASFLTLEPLDEQDSKSVLNYLLGDRKLDMATADYIIATAQGNPLYVEEILAMLSAQGALERSKGLQSDLGSLVLPPSISALIAARVDAVAREERQVLEQASVVGLTFDDDPLIELSVPAVAAQVPDLLASLLRKDLIQYDEEMDGGRYSFRHNLVREVVYEATSKKSRADLHESYAAWLERTPRRSSEETMAFHLERTFAYRDELGDRSAKQRELGGRTAHLLAGVGRRARRRGDVLGAVSSLQRALKVCPLDLPERIEMLIDFSSCHMDAGEMQPAETLLNEARQQASLNLRPELEARAAVALWEARWWTHNVAGWTDEALAEATRAIAVFEELSDELGLALAHRLRALVLQNNYQFAAADKALELALTHARIASDEQEERKILEWYASSSLWGPSSVEEGIGRFEDLRRRFGDNLLVEGRCLIRMAGLAAMQGRFEDARKMVARSRALLDELGAGYLAEVTVGTGIVELMAGEWAKAEKAFRASYEALESLGEVNARIVSASYLAQALYEQGRYEEAESFVRRAEELTPEDDPAARVEWEPVAAKLLARRGNHAAAVELARAAVALAEETDDLSAHAAALVDLSEVLEVAGEPDEQALERAVELYARKGNVVLAERARARMARGRDE
ncbi:MAG TPA: BTAD domain-containing putative transcriptional regulator [Actinomycetota bacterium]|nr:BTAD domain-containing putative transcriptional regulator [Actinomycetota bacterium]